MNHRSRAGRFPRQHAAAADVLIDTRSRSPVLSYLVPSAMKLRPGDGVEVPYGKTTARGMVTALRRDSGKATRHILALRCTRSDQSDVELAYSVARHHFVDPAAVLRRLSPARWYGDIAINPGPARLSAPAPSLPDRTTPRRLVIQGPTHDSSAIVAAEVMRLQSHGQVLVLCPTLSRVHQILGRFASGAVRLDANSPHGHWAAFSTGLAQIGIGTRVAALYSAEQLAGIVVVDEDHPGHQEVAQPHTHARDLAIARSRSLGCDLVLISAVPTPQALHATTSHVTLGPYGGWPTVRVADKADPDAGHNLVLPAMAASITRADRAGRPVLVIASSAHTTRRCSQCGTERTCDQCDNTTCSHLGASPCPKCGGVKVRLTGWDPKRLHAAFGKSVQVTTLNTAPEADMDRTVVLFDLDSWLHAVELYPQQRAARSLAQAAALAGAGGELIIGTSSPDLRLVRELAAGKGLLPWSRRLLEDAVELGLPPACRMVTVSVERKTQFPTAGWPGQVAGPRRVGNRWEALVRIPSEQLLELEPYLLKIRKMTKARIRVE